MAHSPVYTKSKAQRQNNVKQGDYQVAGRPLFVTSLKLSSLILGTFRPWWDINYQGLLFLHS